MAEKIRFVMNKSGVKALLAGAEMTAVCQNAADQIAGIAGDGFAVDIKRGKDGRAIGRVRSETKEAIRKCLKENTLEKAKGSVTV